ncbi:MAG: hypothetical protein ACK40G_00825 [Cytophagaceae bacterium]
MINALVLIIAFSYRVGRGISAALEDLFKKEKESLVFMVDESSTRSAKEKSAVSIMPYWVKHNRNFVEAKLISPESSSGTEIILTENPDLGSFKIYLN